MSFSITVFILEAHQDTTLVAAAVVHTKHLPSPFTAYLRMCIGQKHSSKNETLTTIFF